LSAGAREGDTVVVTSTAPYLVQVRVERGSEKALSAT